MRVNKQACNDSSLMITGVILKSLKDQINRIKQWLMSNKGVAKAMEKILRQSEES